MNNLLFIPNNKIKLTKEDLVNFNDPILTIPKNIKEIVSHACCNKDRLQRVIIQEGTEKIGAYAFGDCVNLEEIFIPLTIEDIHPNAFDGCHKLDVESINNQLGNNIVRKINHIIKNPNQNNYSLLKKLSELNRMISVSSHIYGEYPSHLICPSDIEKLTEYEIFLKILELESQKLTEINLATIKEIDYAKSYLKKQLRKFNIMITDDEINNPSTMTENYSTWLTYWHEHRNNDTSKKLKPKN